jgi:Tol biopolymer transport system component
VRGPIFALWIYDLEAGTRTKLQQDADNGGAVWLPDGQEIVYWSNLDGPYGLYRKKLTGTSPPQRLTGTTTGDIDDVAISADGRYVAFESDSAFGNMGLNYMDLVEGGDYVPFLESPANLEEPAFSPDGRWLAFVSDESGQAEIHVAAFPGPGPNWMISSGGGTMPNWSRDGRELFYFQGNRVLAVEIEPGDQLRVGKTETLFESARLLENYAVADDGRFLMLERVEDEGLERHQIDIVLDWPGMVSP